MSLAGEVIKVHMVFLLAALPEKPLLHVTAPTILGQNVTIWCAAHLGRPTGRINWLLRHTAERDFSLLPANMVQLKFCFSMTYA